VHYEHLLVKHVLPELGPLELRAITPEMIARWQADRLAAGYGRLAIRHAFDLLGSILQRALEGGQIQANPARGVRKGPRPRHQEVRPLPPSSIERMRAASTPRDAALISVLAYAGLRPGEALALQWRDIREQTILVERAVSLGEEKDTKTAAHRTVRLLQPLAADLREWRLFSGRPSGKALVFPSANGGLWTQPAYQSWRRRAFKRALDGAGVEHARPYDLRHSFASLLIHEGRSVIYVARQLGHDARLTLSRYGHVMDGSRDAAASPCDCERRRLPERPLSRRLEGDRRLSSLRELCGGSLTGRPPAATMPRTVAQRSPDCLYSLPVCVVRASVDCDHYPSLRQGDIWSML
jgi:integrase